MRDRLTALASTSTVFLVITMGSYTQAQQETPRPSEARIQNPTVRGERNQAFAGNEVIRGVVAAITAEGEAMFDYRTNRAVAAEAAFLTVVGSPVKSESGEAPRSATGANEERAAANRHRHNVYFVWLSPRTKICEANVQTEKPAAQPETQRTEQKREISLENLEVGDRVEIQFARNDDPGSTGTAHQTEQMRKKHGRHRTHVGFATEVTIIPAKDDRSHGAQTDQKERSN